MWDNTKKKKKMEEEEMTKEEEEEEEEIKNRPACVSADRAVRRGPRDTQQP